MLTDMKFPLASALVVILFQISTSQQEEPPFTLVDVRSLESNIITLRCRRNSDDAFDSEAHYYRNNTRLDSISGFVNTNKEQGTVTFMITRELEGEYSCGREHQRSATVPYIGESLSFLKHNVV